MPPHSWCASNVIFLTSAGAQASAIASCQSNDWLGTFCAHSVSTEVNSGESHFMSFRSSVPVRLRDQHPETGSIPGSSTQKTLVRAASSGQLFFCVKIVPLVEVRPERLGCPELRERHRSLVEGVNRLSFKNPGMAGAWDRRRVG